MDAHPLELRQRAIDLYVSGIPAYKIAEMLSIAKTTVLRWVPKELHREKTSPPPPTYKYLRDAGFFDVIDTEAKAYYLGLIMSDGCINARGCLSLELKAEDGYILLPLRELMSPASPIRVATRTRKHLGYTWTSTTHKWMLLAMPLVASLAKWGIVPNKTYLDLLLPDIDPELMHHFIRGLFDGDGSVWLIDGKRHINFTGSYTLLCNLLEWLKAKAFLTTRAQVRRKSHQKDSVFSISKHSDIDLFANYIYRDCTLCLSRKRDLLIGSIAT